MTMKNLLQTLNISIQTRDRAYYFKAILHFLAPIFSFPHRPTDGVVFRPSTVPETALPAPNKTGNDGVLFKQRVGERNRGIRRLKRLNNSPFFFFPFLPAGFMWQMFFVGSKGRAAAVVACECSLLFYIYQVAAGQMNSK